MAFSVKVDKEDEVDRLNRYLADSIKMRGMPVSPGYKKRWHDDMRALVTEHGSETITSVIDYLGGKGMLNTYCPVVGSASSLRSKFHRLLYVSGANLITQTVLPKAVSITESSPLKWPFPDEMETAWLSQAMEGIDKEMVNLDNRVSMLLGTPWMVAKQWREIKNAFSWKYDISGFESISWVDGADQTYNQILRNYNENEKRFRLR